MLSTLSSLKTRRPPQPVEGIIRQPQQCHDDGGDDDDDDGYHNHDDGVVVVYLQQL